MALEGSSLCLFFASTKSVASDHCQDEINLALDSAKPVINIFLEPAELTPGLRLRLSSHQALMQYDLPRDDYRAKLLEALDVGRPVRRETNADHAHANRYLQFTFGAALAVTIPAAVWWLWPSPAPTPHVETPAPADVEGDVDDYDTGGSEQTAIDQRSIAVLPFTNMSSDPEQEYFADGISEDILNALVRHTDLRVIARTSSFQFKGEGLDIRDIGARLGVTYILEGSVRRAGDRIRVTAQLSRTDDGSHLWSDQYDRVLTDVFAVQDDIVGQILMQLTGQLGSTQSNDRGTDNIAAYNAFLLGKSANLDANYGAAIAHYEQAIALDPTYVDPHVGLAFVHVARPNLGIFPLADEAASVRRWYERARAIDPDRTRVRNLGAFLQAYHDRDYQGAIDIRSKLILVDTSLLTNYGNLLRMVGRYELALRVYEKAMHLDPLRAGLRSGIAVSLVLLGRIDEARAAYAMAEDLGRAQADALADLAFRLQDAEGIRSQLRRDVADWGLNPMAAALARQLAQSRAAYLEGGQVKAAPIIADLEAHPGFKDLTTRIDMALLKEDDLDTAFALLEEGINLGVTQVLFRFTSYRDLDGHPAYGRLLGDPRFEALRREARLDDASLAKLQIPPLPF